jgi:hypothetical protein
MKLIDQLEDYTSTRKRSTKEPIVKNTDRQSDSSYTPPNVSGRSLLRPRYIKSVRGVAKVFPRSLHIDHATTLGSTGGPFYSKVYTLPLSSHALCDVDYYPEGSRTGYKVDKITQWEMFRWFFRLEPQSGIYVISTPINDYRTKQIVFAMLMHMVSVLDCRNVRWTGLYGGLHDDITDNRPSLDAMVLGNIHDGMSNHKFTKLKDILHIYSTIPTILICDGLNPLEFSIKYLQSAPRMVLNIDSRITSHIPYVRKIT